VLIDMGNKPLRSVPQILKAVPICLRLLLQYILSALFLARRRPGMSNAARTQSVTTIMSSSMMVKAWNPPMGAKGAGVRVLFALCRIKLRHRQAIGRIAGVLDGLAQTQGVPPLKARVGEKDVSPAVVRLMLPAGVVIRA